MDPSRGQVGLDDDRQILHNRRIAAQRADPQRLRVARGQRVDIEFGEEHIARDAHPLRDGGVEPPDHPHRRHVAPLARPLHDADAGADAGQQRCVGRLGALVVERQAQRRRHRVEQGFGVVQVGGAGLGVVGGGGGRAAHRQHDVGALTGQVVGAGEEDLARLEDLQASRRPRAAAGVGGVAGQHARPQRRAHARVLRTHRVEQGQGVVARGGIAGAGRDGVERGRAGGGVGDDLAAAGGGQRVADRLAHPARAIEARLRQDASEAPAGQVVVAVDAADLLDDVVGQGDVGTPGRRLHDVGAGRLPAGGQAQAAEDRSHGLGGHGHAGDALQPLRCQLHARRRPLGRVRVGDAVVGDAAPGIQQQPHRPRRGQRRQFRVEPLLETQRGLGALLQGRRRAARVVGREAGRLEQDAGRVRCDLRVGAAHHAGQRPPRGCVGDQQVIRAELVVAAVEQRDRLAGPRPAHHDAALIEAVVVERVQRLAHLQHDEVRHVDDVVDRALPGRGQAPLQPLRRGADADAADDRRDVAAADVGVGDLDGRRLRDRRPLLRVLDLRLAHGLAGQRRHLAGDAEHGEVVGPVGRGRDVEHGLAEHLAQRRPDGGRVVEDEDALVLIGEAELQLRADHAGRDDAADLRPLELAGRAGMRIVEGGALQREGDLLPRRDVGRAADDRLGRVAAVVHGGQAEAVGGGVGLDAGDEADADEVAPVARALDRLHLRAGHREAVRQLLDGQRDGDVVGQPAQRDLHVALPRNCSRKRRSLA